MSKENKIKALEARQAEALKRAAEAERAAARELKNNFLRLSLFGCTVEIWSTRAQKAYQRANEQRQTIAKRYAAIINEVNAIY